MDQVNEQLSAKRRGRKPGSKSRLTVPAAASAPAVAVEAKPARTKPAPATVAKSPPTPEAKRALADRLAAARAAKAAKRAAREQPAAEIVAAAKPALAVVAAAAEAVATPVPTAPIETIEAATSPAVSRDPISAETLAPLQEGLIDMVTVAPKITDTAAETTEKLQSLFGDMGARFKTSFEKSSKLGEEMVELAKGNVEAVVASARVAAKGSEALGQDAAEYSKKSFENAVAAMKSFASVKSPTELFTLQSEFAKASFDSAVAEASKFSESMMKLAGDVAQPLSTRYAVAAEKIKIAAL